MEPAKVYFILKDRNDPISNADDVLRILNNPDMTNVTYATPIRPVAGEVYVYPVHLRNSAKCDQWRWRNTGRHPFPKRDSVVYKTTYNTADKTPNGSAEFRRIEFFPIDPKGRFMMMQYVGDEKKARQFPHGNSKGGEKEFIRPADTVKAKIQELASTGSFPATVYRKSMEEKVANEAVSARFYA